ncbi:hypothetical protein ACOJUR_08890 [Alicyclobacillus tolerans]
MRRWCEEWKLKAQRTLGGMWKIFALQFEGVVILAPKEKRSHRRIESVAGVWKDQYQ